MTDERLSLVLPSLTVADLTDDYAGWYIKVHVGDDVIRWRHLELKSVRRWEYEGQGHVGVVAKDPDGRFAGIEYHFPIDAEVVLEKPITAKAKRKAKEMADARQCS